MKVSTHSKVRVIIKEIYCCQIHDPELSSYPRLFVTELKIDTIQSENYSQHGTWSNKQNRVHKQINSQLHLQTHRSKYNEILSTRQERSSIIIRALDRNHKHWHYILYTLLFCNFIIIYFVKSVSIHYHWPMFTIYCHIATVRRELIYKYHWYERMNI